MGVLTIGSVLLAILALSVLILVHEFGHFGMARVFKIPVYEFSVGMGPALWKKKRGDTLYSIRAIPLGGYCAFDDDASINSGDLNLYKYPIWKRSLVIFAGPLMNILTAFVIAFLIVSCIGLQTVVPEISSVNAGSPAEEAGLLADDVFLSVNGIPVDGNRDVLSAAFAENGENPALVVVERDGQTLEVTVTPRLDESTGQYMLGIYLKTVYVPQPIGTAASVSVTWIGSMVKELLSFLGGLISRGQGAEEMTGVVGTVAILSDTVKSGAVAELLTMVAFISINLGVFNLIPFPALDGGKLVLYGVEAITRKRLTIGQEMVVQTIGLAFFALLFIVMTYRDIARLFQGGWG